MNIFERINDLKEEVSVLEFLYKTFPDIKIEKDRWGHVYYCSKSVDVNVDKFEVYHSCGCCPDPAIMFSAWVEVSFRGRVFRIYASKPRITVGEVDFAGDEIIFEKAIKTFDEFGLSDAAKEFITEYAHSAELIRAARHAEEDEDEEEDDFDDDEVDQSLPSAPQLRRYEKDFDDGSEAAKRGFYLDTEEK